ncbi:MAG: hypothetical protein IKQ92_01105 [Clostridia bacterium]|nr:hypothetical protein [Clostridia bacterium]
MENKTGPEGRFFTAAGVVLAVLFTAMLSIPLCLLILFGQDKTVLDGEKQYEAPDFHLGEYVSSDFQRDFENWFSEKYPLRGNFVSMYRQLQFDTSDIGFDIATLFVPRTPKTDGRQDAGTVQPADPAPGKSEGEGAGDAMDTAQQPEQTSEPVNPYPYSTSNSLYAEINKRLYERDSSVPSAYKGTDQVIIGNGGYCYENGYINEFYGYSRKYRDCTEEYLQDRVEKLTYIQNQLKKRGIEMILVITPNKAEQYERFIPDWFKAQNTAPDDYVRPVTKLLELLKNSEVNYIHCASLYDEIGLDETFPLTGTHWNKLAAFEAVRAILDMYNDLSGDGVRTLTTNKITSSKRPSGFGNGETDIFDIAYSGLSTKSATRDSLYYWPEVEYTDPSNKTRMNVLVQGGSFCWDFKHYFQTYTVSRRFEQFYYNDWRGASGDDPLKKGYEKWEKILSKIDCVILECNEQMVCNMGGKAPAWGPNDKTVLDPGSNVYDSLYLYLKSAEE